MLTPLQIKIAVVGILFAIIAGLGFYAHVQTKRVDSLQDEVKMLKANLDACQGKLSIHEQAVIEGQKKLQEAEAERQKRIAALNAQIAALRKKRPPEPTNCEAVIDWAKKNKDDLQWK